MRARCKHFSHTHSRAGVQVQMVTNWSIVVDDVTLAPFIQYYIPYTLQGGKSTLHPRTRPLLFPYYVLSLTPHVPSAVSRLLLRCICASRRSHARDARLMRASLVRAAQTYFQICEATNLPHKFNMQWNYRSFTTQNLRGKNWNIELMNALFIKCQRRTTRVLFSIWVTKILSFTNFRVPLCVKSLFIAQYVYPKLIISNIIQFVLSF